MEWPFYDPKLILLVLMFFGAVAGNVLAFRLWRTVLRERRPTPNTLVHAASVTNEVHSVAHAGMVTFAAIVFTLVGGLAAVYTSAGKFQFRSLPLEKLVAIEVYRAADEYSVDRSQTVRIENQDGRLLEGLDLLKKCGARNRDHEHFEDGYVLRRVFDDPNLVNYYVSVFRTSSTRANKTVVMPQRSHVRDLNLGEYSCPAFQDWVRTNIDPLF